MQKTMNILQKLPIRYVIYMLISMCVKDVEIGKIMSWNRNICMIRIAQQSDKILQQENMLAQQAEELEQSRKDREELERKIEELTKALAAK